MPVLPRFFEAVTLRELEEPFRDFDFGVAFAFFFSFLSVFGSGMSPILILYDLRRCGRVFAPNGRPNFFFLGGSLAGAVTGLARGRGAGEPIDDDERADTEVCVVKLKRSISSSDNSR